MFFYPRQISLLLKFIFIAQFLIIVSVVEANSNDVRILEPRDKVDPAYGYFIDLTKLVLSKTQHLYPNSKLTFIPHYRMTQARSLRLLNDNNVDLIWAGTSTYREQLYTPIYFPLFRGLLGYRVLLIRKGDKAKFSLMERPKQLKELVACQGAHWPDSDILESNGYKVTRVVHFDAMFKMLAKKRCDYFPRAIFEGEAEQKEIVNDFPNITLLDQIILHYNFPIYYFVAKNNTKLAQRLMVGLNQSLEDGSLMQLMQTHSVSKHLFPLSQWKEKRFFELSNNDFNTKAKENNPQFWINLKAMD
jgi:hypothetical protein